MKIFKIIIIYVFIVYITFYTTYYVLNKSFNFIKQNGLKSIVEKIWDGENNDD